MLTTPDNIQILYEDNHLIAINKRPSDIVQGDKTGDTPLSEVTKAYLKKKYDKPGEVFLGVAHRIDRPVSGVVVFARTSKALARLNQLFKDKLVTKTYWAVVKNPLKKASGTLIHYLQKNEKKNKSIAKLIEFNNSKKAELDYKTLKKSDNYTLLEIKPKTGRHHQIRVQLSAIGCPIKGDIKYGFKRTNRDASIHLHARKVEFVHPVKKEHIAITAPAPEENLWKVFEKTTI